MGIQGEGQRNAKKQVDSQGDISETTGEVTLECTDVGPKELTDKKARASCVHIFYKEPKETYWGY